MQETSAASRRKPARASGGARSVRQAVEGNPLWYHTIDLAPGVVTPGWFDQRSVVATLPWPDVRGKRCLDVGTYDGFLAFELERRGASEVVATDIGDHSEWDWPPCIRAHGPEYLAAIAGPEKGLGFRIAKDVLGSTVERVELNVYDLSPERVGRFDFVVCGALMLHLRDPIRALENIRSVCGESFLSIEAISAGLSLAHPKRPLARLHGGAACQWWVPNAAGHRRMLEVAGFAPQGDPHPYPVPLGSAHPGRRSRTRRLRPRASALRRRAINKLAVGGDGVPHMAVLSLPTL